MVQTDSVKDMLLHLYQKNTSRENLKLTQVTKNSFQLYGFLLNLQSRPKEIESNGNLSKHKLLKDFSPVDSLLAEIYSMRCCRKYGRAQKLEEVASKWINKLTECQPNVGHDFEKCLKFLLHLSNWENADKTILGSPWTIPVISQTILREDESGIPSTHGDSNIYKTSFCYSHYPDKIFEEVETISESEDDFPGIFEATPGRDRNGNTLFKIPDNRSNSINYKGFFLFGAVRSPTTLMREDSTDISLSLPILTNRQPNPMMYSLSAINSTDKQKKSELTPSPEDEGFVDVESGVTTPEQYDPTSIWEEVCKAKDLLPPRTWETRIGPPRPLNKRTMLTSAGPEATNNVYLNYLHDLQLMAGLSSGSLLPAGPLLTLGQLFLDVVHLLFGVASDTFLFEADTRKFYIKSSSYVTGSTPETVGRMMEDFLDCGAIYVNLEEFSSGMETDYLSHAGFVLQRFKEGVSDYLQYYRGFILHAAETHGESLLLFHRKILGIYRQLRYLNDLCAGEKNVQARIGLRMGLPKGLQLLTYLYDQAIKDWGGDNTYLLLFLLRCACAPYLVFLQNWLFDAKFYDPHSEYDVEIQENFLSEDFGELFWQEGFKLKAKLRSVPFLGPIISKAILVCGKSLNLLKMCHPKHDLLDGRHQLRPVLSISLTQNELKTTQDCSEAYFKSLNAKMEKPKNNVIVKKIELKTCVDVTIPKIGDNNVLISTVPTRTRSVDPKEVRVIVEEEDNAKPNPPVKPKINYPPKLKDMEEEMMSERDQEFQRIESELIKELTDEYQEMVEAEDRKLELINWQSKRLGLETESAIEFVSKNVSETVESYSSSTVTGTEKHSIQTETTTKICKELSNLSTDQNEYDDVEDDFEIDSDSESLPTVRERVTLITPQLDSNIQEEDDIELPQDDEMFDDDGDFKDDETIVEEKSEDTVKDDDNDDDARSETRCDEIDDDDEDDTNDDDGIENNEINKQDMESSLYKSMYLIHEPAPYEDQYNTFGSCPSRDLFSIAKSASQIFAPSDDLNDQDDMTSDVIPLPILIQRSLHPPLLAQIRLVNRATLNFFNEELKINDHFEALRNFFFFQDGEFGHSLSQLIFDKLRDGSHQLYNSLSNPFELMSILETALCSSLPSSKESNLGDNLYLINARSNSQRQESDHVDVTKYISLKYKVTWPLNIIITESCLQSYDKIFSLLLRVKQVIWALTNCWYHLKNKDNKYGKLSGVLEYRRIQLFRHEMLHFIRSVHTHICCQLLQLSWAEFREKIKNKVQDLDDLKTAHESYLNFALRRCLLAKDQEIVLKILERSFALIQQFHLQVISLSWECGRCCDDKGFERIMKTRSDFLSYSLKLYKVLKASLKKHRQPYVVDFLVLLDFNGFYDQSLVASLRNAKN